MSNALKFLVLFLMLWFCYGTAVRTGANIVNADYQNSVLCCAIFNDLTVSAYVCVLDDVIVW